MTSLISKDDNKKKAGKGSSIRDVGNFGGREEPKSKFADRCKIPTKGKEMSKQKAEKI